jgi:hypothetical protein
MNGSMLDSQYAAGDDPVSNPQPRMTPSPRFHIGLRPRRIHPGLVPLSTYPSLTPPAPSPPPLDNALLCRSLDPPFVVLARSPASSHHLTSPQPRIQYLRYASASLHPVTSEPIPSLVPITLPSSAHKALALSRASFTSSKPTTPPGSRQQKTYGTLALCRATCASTQGSQWAAHVPTLY